MSYLEIYGIVDATGELESLGEIRNANGFQPIVWNHLAAIYDMDDPLNVFETFSSEPKSPLPHEKRVRDLWYNFGNRKVFSFEDSVLLGSTLDGMWIDRKNLLAYTIILKRFWDRILGEGRYVDVIPQMVEVLKKAETNESLRGVCYYACSISNDPWYFRSKEDEDGETYVEWRRYNFNTDRELPNDRLPWELFEGESFLHEQVFSAHPLGPPSKTHYRHYYDLRNRIIRLQQHPEMKGQRLLQQIADEAERVEFNMKAFRYGATYAWPEENVRQMLEYLDTTVTKMETRLGRVLASEDS